MGLPSVVMVGLGVVDAVDAGVEADVIVVDLVVAVAAVTVEPGVTVEGVSAVSRWQRGAIGSSDVRGLENMYNTGVCNFR